MMNWFETLILFILIFDGLALLAAYVAVYFVKPRCPAWWEAHIIGLYAEEVEL